MGGKKVEPAAILLLRGGGSVTENELALFSFQDTEAQLREKGVHPKAESCPSCPYPHDGLQLLMPVPVTAVDLLQGL